MEDGYAKVTPLQLISMYGAESRWMYAYVYVLLQKLVRGTGAQYVIPSAV